ncbi:putative reverse transcriptase domain-containing protein [Tanacetum coccineum]
MSEARISEVIREQVAASMAEFMANMNRGAGGAGAGGARASGARAGGAGAGGTRAGSAGAGGGGAGGGGAGGAGAGSARVGGAGPAAPKITGCTYVTFMKCDPQPFKGTEGAVGLCQWFEKLESVFRISDCKERDKKNIRGDLYIIEACWHVDEAVALLTSTWTNNTKKTRLMRFLKCEKEERKDVTCFKCNEKGHRKRDCPKLNKNGQGVNNRGAIYKLGAMDAQQDPKVVTDTSYEVESGNEKYNITRKYLKSIIGMDWLSRYDAAILCGVKKAQVKTEQELKEKAIEDVPCYLDFLEVISDEIPGTYPHPGQVESVLILFPVLHLWRMRHII